MSEIKYLVSPSQLAEQLENRDVVIVDCRFQLSDPNWGYQQYLDGHIPGAYYLDLDRDLSAPVERHGGRHPLPAPEVLAAKLGKMGVTRGQTTVIAYDSSGFAFSARLWWLLRYLGHDRVALLDGGWSAYLAAGYPLTTTVPASKESKFMPQIQLDWIVTRENVKICQDSSDVVIIDARAGARYRGESEPIDPIAGHIQGALNSPWQQVTDSLGFLQPLSAQQQLWGDDVRRAREVIVYCGSGVTACVNILSLSLVGIANVKLYPGGWSDWCSYLEV